MRIPALSLAVLSLLLLGTACDSSDPSPPAPTGRAANPPAATFDAGCTEAYPALLKVETKVAAEMPYLNQVTACTTRGTAPTTTLLRNTGEVVWKPHATFQAFGVLKETVRAKSFRALFATAPLLLPDTDITLKITPALLQWDLDPALSAAWQAHEYVADLLKGYGEKQLGEALSGNSLRRKAMSSCVLAGYNAYEQAGTLRSGSAADAMIASWSLTAKAGQCAYDWKNAGRLETGKLATLTWEDELLHMRTNVKWMSKTDDLLAVLQRIGKALVVAR